MTDTQKLSQADIVAAITAATEEVFGTMLGIGISAGDVQVENTVAAAPASGLVSLIGLAGNWSGTGSMACTGTLACTMATAMLMTPYESVNEEVLDAVGEVSNMIIGNVKTFLEEKVGPMGLSTPTVIFGRNFQTRSARIHAWTVVPFVCGEERLYIQICIAPSQDPDHATTLRPGFQIPSIVTI